jgi:hypothetical protein
MFRYETPAGQNDFVGHPREQEHLERWSSWIDGQVRSNIDELRRLVGASQPMFFSEADHPILAGTPSTPVPWVGFPRNHVVANNDRTSVLDAAEQRRTFPLGFEDQALTRPVNVSFRWQDEYLEWVAVKDAGNVTRYVFTAEGPEYWEFLASADREIVRRLYSEFTGREVQWSELAWAHDVWVADQSGNPVLLYARGDYNPYNRVNLDECAAHLTHPANTLSAEIDLAVKATIQRVDAKGARVTERRRLACCSNFGDPNRNSDPGIGTTVNLAVAGGTSITLANPVGLYIQRFDGSRVAGPNGEALAGWWNFTRGRAGRGLRAEFAPPTGATIALSDVRVGNNEQLTHGGQLAELVTMVLYAQTLDLGNQAPPALRCSHRCCSEKGRPPERSVLDHIRRAAPCPDGWVNAFPELAPTGMAFGPLSARRIGRTLKREGSSNGD